MKHALFLYDFLGAMAEPWRKAGVNVWLFDGKHPDGTTKVRTRKGEGAKFTVGLWFEPKQIARQALRIVRMVRDSDPDAEIIFVGGFPECTDLTNCGTRWWPAKRLANPRFQEDARDLFTLVEKVAQAAGGVPWFAENPRVNALNRLYRRYDHWFNPCEYGGYLPRNHQHKHFPEVYPGRDAYRKPTGIWCGFGFTMPERKPVPPVGKDFPGWKKCGGKSERTKEIRSATPEGFAVAVFEANMELIYK